MLYVKWHSKCAKDSVSRIGLEKEDYIKHNQNSDNSSYSDSVFFGYQTYEWYYNMYYQYSKRQKQSDRVNSVKFG